MLSTDKIKILVIEDEEYDVRRIKNTIKPFNEKIEIQDVFSEGSGAINFLENHKVDVVIMDFQIHGGLKGEKLIRKIKEIDETIQIIVVTKMTMNITDFDFANKLLEAGAMWYCSKYPSDIDDYIYQPTDFILSIYNAYEKRKLQRAQRNSAQKLQKNIQDLLENKRIIGDSKAMQRLQKQIITCANSDVNVLILGASGTGKELVAVNIHYNSSRKFENFVPINCGSLPDHLVESELFGFEKGSFTGASNRKKGFFEIAHNGTVFLDEISELPLPAQTKLLRVIQEGEIDKIGRTGKIKVDVRVIAASNKDLRKEVTEKRFREDLFYRLNVVYINVPSLNEKKEDIPALLSHFMDYYSQKMKLKLPVIEQAAINVFQNYDWPGNVRQLQNVVQRLLFMKEDNIDTYAAQIALGIPPSSSNSIDFNLQDILKKHQMKSWHEMELNFQAEYFRFVRDNSSSDADAARILGLAPPNYHRMCKRLGIK